MKIRERLEYAQEQIEKGRITSSSEYLNLIKGTIEDRVEDKIEHLSQYLLYLKLQRIEMENEKV